MSGCVTAGLINDNSENEIVLETTDMRRELCLLRAVDAKLHRTGRAPRSRRLSPSASISVAVELRERLYAIARSATLHR